VVNSNSNQRANIQRLLEKLILEEDQFDVHDILPNTVPDPASLNLESDYACPVGEVVMAPDCGKTPTLWTLYTVIKLYITTFSCAFRFTVPCSVGSYFEKETKKCVPCAVGSYQSESGQLQCSVCPAIAGRQGVTVSTGARSASHCKERCPAGKYYDDEAGLCRSCGYGFYQPSEGSFKCLLCGLGKTTRTTEAVSREVSHTTLVL